MNKKVLSVISMSLAIGLSCITNLITSDDSVVYWFNTNKRLVIILAVILTLASIVISYLSESDIAKENKVQRNNIKLFTNIFLNAVLMLIFGLLVSFLVLFGCNYYLEDSGLANQITIIVVGAFVGTEFKYVGGDVFIGLIVGAFLAYAFSYYFPENFTLEFLPHWLNQKSIISSGIFCGIIGLYTGVYKGEVMANEKKQREINKLNYAKDLENYQSFKKFFTTYNYELFSSNFFDDVKRFQYQVFGANKETKKMLLEKREEIKSNEEPTPFKFITNIISELTSKDHDSLIKLKKPFYLYDNKLSLVKKFNSVEEIKKFVENNEIKLNF